MEARLSQTIYLKPRAERRIKESYQLGHLASLEAL